MEIEGYFLTGTPLLTVNHHCAIVVKLNILQPEDTETPDTTLPRLITKAIKEADAIATNYYFELFQTPY